MHLLSQKSYILHCLALVRFTFSNLLLVLHGLMPHLAFGIFSFLFSCYLPPSLDLEPAMGYCGGRNYEPLCKTHRSMKVDHMHHLLRDILSLCLRGTRFIQLHFVPLCLNIKQRMIKNIKKYKKLTRFSLQFAYLCFTPICSSDMLSKRLTFTAKCRPEHIHVCLSRCHDLSFRSSCMPSSLNV